MTTSKTTCVECQLQNHGSRENTDTRSPHDAEYTVPHGTHIHEGYKLALLWFVGASSASMAAIQVVAHLRAIVTKTLITHARFAN